ncbi:hypothetical protein AAS23_gp29 [Pantoea phage vB_PagS_AAS23]|uniref:Uncharacterized protein n=1 Tax=Pantoea phage vB_PagS_AAS23 TaxID=2499073 RepID=A0A3S9U7R0_9CAUD|nr:hypothetical protein HOU93_gp29 [Pantoea phage vB_PagS_AAS23]AZS06342.1 hypothetical protein AAS23_gp29 [Pantoea phage vB_PagS_AAS23]
MFFILKSAATFRKSCILYGYIFKIKKPIKSCVFASDKSYIKSAVNLMPQK